MFTNAFINNVDGMWWEGEFQVTYTSIPYTKNNLTDVIKKTKYNVNLLNNQLTKNEISYVVNNDPMNIRDKSITFDIEKFDLANKKVILKCNGYFQGKITLDLIIDSNITNPVDLNNIIKKKNIGEIKQGTKDLPVIIVERINNINNTNLIFSRDIWIKGLVGSNAICIGETKYKGEIAISWKWVN
ncbi:hypothetical protein [Spiroplasma endosymbiont of Colias croceus]|uniref:hypothetical protein n=1 Tax=Spiroplasma endosymbiont of Colias croceus TaxID=3066310 RepID=UPI0030CF4FD2